MATKETVDETQRAALQATLDTIFALIDAGIPAGLAIKLVTGALEDGENELGAKVPS